MMIANLLSSLRQFFLKESFCQKFCASFGQCFKQIYLALPAERMAMEFPSWEFGNSDGNCKLQIPTVKVDGKVR